MKKKVIILFFCIASIIIFQKNLNAYSLKVHEQITIEVINQNKAKLNKYLTDIGLPNGVEDELKSGNDKRKVRKWIEDGSWKEDLNWQYLFDPLFSHFYNPLTNKSGVGDSWLSAYEWADATSNSWSWTKARENFYKGLTLKTKTEREGALADAFRALGHVIHLVQDVSVPAHARGDLHISEPYEKYTNKNIGNLNYTLFPFTGPNSSVSSGAPKQLWDSDTYDGKNPSSTANIGLAEYTNANFFSDDTIFRDFPHPAKENTTAKLVEQTAKDGKTDKVWYIQGYTSEKLAAYSYMNKSLSSDKWEYNLNNYVYEDYASQLIPRAVGYSAGLLNYFFRGTIDMISDNATGSGYVIENKTDENMEGTFELWYDDINDNRKMIWNGYLSIVPNGKSSNITFTKPTDAKESCKYVLVLNKGTMGQEQGAVVGKVVYTIENCSSLTIVDEDGTPATDTILRNGTLDFKTTDGCCGDIVWSVSVETGSTLGGSTITQAGVLTAGSTSCGSLKVTATCGACGTSATQYVRVMDAGQWVEISYTPYCFHGYEPGSPAVPGRQVSSCIVGKNRTDTYMAAYTFGLGACWESLWVWWWGWCPVVCNAGEPCSNIYHPCIEPYSKCGGGTFTAPVDLRLTQILVYEWQCP